MSTITDARDDPDDRFFALLAARWEDDDPADFDEYGDSRSWDWQFGDDPASDPPDLARFAALSVPLTDEQGYAVPVTPADGA